MAAPQVELSDIKGPEGERVRRLYATRAPAADGKERAPGPRKVRGKTFQERSAPARAKMRERKQNTRAATKNAAARRTRATRAIRATGRRSLRMARTVHTAAGGPGAVIGRIVGMFVGAGILVAVVRNPAIVTVPLRFIGSIAQAFGALIGKGGGAPAPPRQNVAAPRA